MGMYDLGNKEGGRYMLGVIFCLVLSFMNGCFPFLGAPCLLSSHHPDPSSAWNSGQSTWPLLGPTARPGGDPPVPLALLGGAPEGRDDLGWRLIAIPVGSFPASSVFQEV